MRALFARRRAARRRATLAPIRAGIAARRLPSDIAPDTARLILARKP